MAGLSPIVSVRVSSREHDLLCAAAAHARTTLSDFVRRQALDAAEIDLFEHRQVIIPAADWEKFEAWASAPARDVPALRKLSSSTPAWQE